MRKLVNPLLRMLRMVVQLMLRKGTGMQLWLRSLQKKPAEGELHLYPIPVKTQSGEKLELQLSPGDSVIDVKQFLLDAPETCFYTCYDLILHTKDGSTHQLEDYNEISEIADITSGGCSLEMVAGLYDERSIRSHLRRVRELLSLSTLHVSLSTSLALQQESAQGKSADAGKAAIQELDGLNFMEDTTVALTNLLASSPAEIKCVDSIVFFFFQSSTELSEVTWRSHVY
uniref:Clustered mitochondria protein N-terminal domain-containing protein n=1 Tax=Arundo donax TaxID=35708 RepID=A0A0A9BKP6_ARUDO